MQTHPHVSFLLAILIFKFTYEAGTPDIDTTNTLTPIIH